MEIFDLKMMPFSFCLDRNLSACYVKMAEDIGEATEIPGVGFEYVAGDCNNSGTSKSGIAT
jgi:hypothetical protein